MTDARDKIVVTVEPTAPSERLDIADAFQQVLDYLRLVELAASEDADFDWKLEKASTNSPFTVVAFTPVGSVTAKHQQSLAVAQRRTEQGLKELASGTVPPWMRKRQRNAARRITRRFHDNIGRMSLKTGEDSKSAFLLNRRLAKQALTTLDKVDGIEEVIVPQHTSYGEIEGLLLGVGTYYGRPALWVRANGYDVIRCVVEQDKLDQLGDDATIKEVWEQRRVRIVGALTYAEGGNFLGLINSEAGKHADCLSVWSEVERGETQIVTSFFTFAEVFKAKCEGKAKPLDEIGEDKVAAFFASEGILPITVDRRTAELARRLMRRHPECGKPSDAVHLATAILLNVDEMHTYDGSDLLDLNKLVARQDGEMLTICTPYVAQSELFAGGTDVEAKG